MSEKDKEEVTSLVVETLLKFEEEKLIMQNDKPWHKKPVGAIFIGVAIILIGSGIITFFASFSGSQRGLIQVQSDVKNTTEATLRNEKAIEKVDLKIDKVDNKIDKTDKEWRDAVTKFYKDNPDFRDGSANYNTN